MKKSLTQIISGLTFLPNRTPAMAFTGEGNDAFAEVTPYRDGAIYVGHYSGNSEWEQHSAGDEIVMALSGSTTVVLLKGGLEEKIALHEGDLTVVPQGLWHRFEDSRNLKVFTITPQPTTHSIEKPDA
jgi:mannose-6-phosphate isomerase-like protein (cupin superfamily)